MGIYGTKNPTKEQQGNIKDVEMSWIMILILVLGMLVVILF